MMNNIAMDISLEYFDWLVDLVQGYEHVKLLRHMHETTYIWIIPNDENRADDGEALRSRFYMKLTIQIMIYQKKL